MEYQATAKYIRTGPRKLRLVADAVRGMQVTAAIAALKAMPAHGAKPMYTVIESALANAKVKKAKEDTLVLAAVEVMEGPRMKRWHAVSRGMAHGYKKQMSHIRVVLSDTNSVEKEGKK